MSIETICSLVWRLFIGTFEFSVGTNILLRYKAVVTDFWVTSSSLIEHDGFIGGASEHAQNGSIITLNPWLLSVVGRRLYRRGILIKVQTRRGWAGPSLVKFGVAVELKII